MKVRLIFVNGQYREFDAAELTLTDGGVVKITEMDGNKISFATELVAKIELP